MFIVIRLAIYLNTNHGVLIFVVEPPVTTYVSCWEYHNSYTLADIRCVYLVFQFFVFLGMKGCLMCLRYQFKYIVWLRLNSSTYVIETTSLHSGESCNVSALS